MATVKKFHMGDKFEETNGKQFTLLSGDSWAVVNANGQVVDWYGTKKAAQMVADEINAEQEG